MNKEQFNGYYKDTKMSFEVYEWIKHLEKENESLLKTVEGLAKEAKGFIYAHQYAIAADGGNSNMKVMEIRINTALEALAQVGGGK